MIKILHMATASLVLFLFILRVVSFFINKGAVPENKKAIFIALHILYALLVFTGFWQAVVMYQAAGALPYWLLAKILLFVVALSIGFKMVRSDASAQQYAVGLAILTLVYGLIVALVVVKPVL